MKSLNLIQHAINELDERKQRKKNTETRYNQILPDKNPIKRPQQESHLNTINTRKTFLRIIRY
jgi:hypothetical protein